MARSDQILRSSLELYGSSREILDEVVLSDIFLAFYIFDFVFVILSTMSSTQILESGELIALLASIDSGLERLQTLKRSQLISLCSSLGKAVSHFRSPQISPQFLAADPPIILEIVVSESTQVGGVVSDNFDGSVVSCCEKGVGDSPVFLAQKSVSTQITSTRPSPSIPRARSARAQAPPVRREVHYIHAPPMPRPRPSMEDESEYPPGYYDDSDNLEEEERDYYGHLAPPLFSGSGLEQDETLDTGFQGDSYGGVFEPPLGEEFSPQNDFSVGVVSIAEPQEESDDDVDDHADDDFGEGSEVGGASDLDDHYSEHSGSLYSDDGSGSGSGYSSGGGSSYGHSDHS